MAKREIDYSLYLITDRAALTGRDLLEGVEEAIKGGVTLVQLREKNLLSKDYFEIAVQVKKLVGKYNTPLIINDRIDIALAVGADGVHLGPEDLPIAAARDILGPDRIIGASANCVEEALRFQKQGADYLGVGALFPTATKTNTEHVSLEELQNIKKAVHIPIVGIGGVSISNAPSVVSAGIDGLAVVSAILSAGDICEAARSFRNIIGNC